MRHEIRKTDEIPATGSKIVPFFGHEVHVYRSGERVRAAVNICLHFGGPLECRDGKLVCAWHKASFDMANGGRIDGPAPKDSKLMFLTTRTEGDALFYVWRE